jgi:hypothetical protein
MRREKWSLNVLERVALLLSVPCVMVTASEAQECGEPNHCHPDSFLEFGSWVFTADPAMIARCDGYQVLVVKAHGYKPPQQFIEAVLACPSFSSGEYRSRVVHLARS